MDASNLTKKGDFAQITEPYLLCLWILSLHADSLIVRFRPFWYGLRGMMKFMDYISNSFLWVLYAMISCESWSNDHQFVRTIQSISIGALLHNKLHGLYLQIVYMSVICNEKPWEVTQRSPIPSCDLTILIGSPIWDKIHELYLEFTYVSAICDYADPMTTNSLSPMGLFVCTISSVLSDRAFAMCVLHL